jgi:hypothetical protein
MFWPKPLAWQWSRQYPELFDADDVRIARTQTKYHFAEWFTAIHLFHRDGVLSLIEKYIFRTHPRKWRRLDEIQDGLFGQLQEIGRSLRVQPPDLLLYSRDNTLRGFAEVKGPGDRKHPSLRQLQSHREIEQRLGVPVETVIVRLLPKRAG